MVEKRAISLPEPMDAEVNERRGNVPRSQWIQEAIQARMNAEDVGEWETPEIESRVRLPGGGDES